MSNRIICVKYQYLKLFNCVPELNHSCYITILVTTSIFQSAGAVEYADCTSAEGLDTPQ